MKGFATTTDEDDGVGSTTIGVVGMRGDSGDARDKENNGKKEIAHLCVHEHR
jgi:hypothetical protein